MKRSLDDSVNFVLVQSNLGNLNYFCYRSGVHYSFAGTQVHSRDGGFFYSVLYKGNHCFKYYAPQWNKVS